jgi:hypothetical protein
MPAVKLVVCAAPLSRRINDIAAFLKSDGWAISVIGTPSAIGWFDTDQLTATLGERPTFNYRDPGQQKSDFRPDIVAVCPATFNTVNKIAAGIADNYATGFLCESLGAKLPLLLAPMVNEKLAGHFAWADTVGALKKAGARFLDIRTGAPDVAVTPSGTGDQVVRQFQPVWLADALRDALALGR